MIIKTLRLLGVTHRKGSKIHHLKTKGCGMLYFSKRTKRIND
jgi:hypothetical protein